MSKILILAKDADDGTDYVLGHPEIREHHITVAWPWHLERVRDGVFDRLIITAGFRTCERWERMAAAARTRLVNPAPVVHVTTDHAELMGLGGSDA